MSLVTPAEVREQTGAPTTLISDADIQSIIDETELQIQSVWQVKFTPTETIEIRTGSWKDRILVEENFPLTVYTLINGSSTMDVDNLFVHTDDSFVEIYGDTITGQWADRFSGYDLSVKMRYLYGAVEKDTTITTDLNGAVVAGTAISVTVDSTTGFTGGDWVMLEDLNRRREVAQITTVDSGTAVTMAKLMYAYEDNAMFTLTKTMEVLRQLSLYESSLGVMIYAIGSTYTIATGYTYPEYSVQKGVPYTHWLNAYDRTIKKANDTKNRVKMLTGAIV